MRPVDILLLLGLAGCSSDPEASKTGQSELPDTRPSTQPEAVPSSANVESLPAEDASCQEMGVPVPGEALCLDPEMLSETREEFGVPMEWLEFEFTTTEELSALVEQRNKRLAESGFRFRLDGETVLFEADLPWLTKEVHTLVQPLASTLLADLDPSTSPRDRVVQLARYVQGLDEIDPPLTRVNSRGETRTSTGLQHPVETLALGGGDCDSLTLLFGSMVHASLDLPLVYLGTEVEGIPHRLAAVGVLPSPGDLSIRVEGLDYLVLDLTVSPTTSGVSRRAVEVLESTEVVLEHVR